MYSICLRAACCFIFANPKSFVSNYAGTLQPTSITHMDCMRPSFPVLKVRISTHCNAQMPLTENPSEIPSNPCVIYQNSILVAVLMLQISHN